MTDSRPVHARPNDCAACSENALRISVFDLVGRTVVDDTGTQCLIQWVYLDTGSGRLMIELSELDEDGNFEWYSDFEVDSLEDWALVCTG